MIRLCMEVRQLILRTYLGAISMIPNSVLPSSTELGSQMLSGSRRCLPCNRTHVAHRCNLTLTTK